MKRSLIIFLVFLFCLTTLPVPAAEQAYASSRAMITATQDLAALDADSLKAEGIVLMEQRTGKILFERNAHAKMYPASTTKILTALLTLENTDLDETVTVGKEIYLVTKDGSKAGLKVGKKLTVRELLMGLLLPSGNDAAYTLGVYVARKRANNPEMEIEEAVAAFADLMNQRAKELGAKGSHFVNPHGYHDDDHYTTPYDLALIAREAMKNSYFREVVKTARFEAKALEVPAKEPTEDSKGSKAQKVFWTNTNALIKEGEPKYYYPYATGIKTGYTSKAGFCVVSSASKDEMDVIAVVLKDTSNQRWKDAAALLDYGLTNFSPVTVVKKDEIMTSVEVVNVEEGDSGKLDVLSDIEFMDVFKKQDVQKIKKEIQWDESLLAPSEPAENPEDASGQDTTVQEPQDEARTVQFQAPIRKGQKLGKAVFSLDGETLVECNLVAARDVQEKKKLIEKIIPESPGLEQKVPNWVWVAVGVIVLFLIFRWIAYRRRRRRWWRRR